MQKQGELVTLSTRDVSRAFPVTDSLKVAEVFKKEHKTVLRSIRKLYENLKISLPEDEIGLHQIVLSYYENEQGKKQPMYLMNETFFNMLVMGFTGKEALLYKHEFIKAFLRMKNELLARSETRHIGKIARRSLTDAIKDYVKDEGSFKKFAYGNYSKLIYKKILGTTVKKYKELNGIPEKDNIRDYLTIETLDKVQEIEGKIADIIEFNDTLNDKELYQKIKSFIEERLK